MTEQGLILFTAIIVIFVVIKLSARVITLAWKYAGWILFFLILFWIIPKYFPEVVEQAQQMEQSQ